MQTSASTQPWSNSNQQQNGIKNSFKNNNLIDNMINLTPNFYGLDTMINGLKDMMRGGKLLTRHKGKEMTMITPVNGELNSGPSVPGEVSFDPFFQASPKIPVNFMPSAAINEISSDGWTINNGINNGIGGTSGIPLPQADLGLGSPISSSFGDNTLTNPAGTY